MFQLINIAEFQDRSGLKFGSYEYQWNSARFVASLRDLVKVEASQDMPESYLYALLGNVCLEEDPTVHPYKGCRLDLIHPDQSTLEVGQTFVLESRVLDMMQMSKCFKHIPGLAIGVASLPPKIILGQLKNGERAIAHYLPPIIESCNGNENFLLDGIHRNYMVKAGSGRLCCIQVKEVKTPRPCVTVAWDTIKMVKEKPPREQRFHNLDTRFFRDLKYIGIDG